MSVYTFYVKQDAVRIIRTDDVGSEITQHLEEAGFQKVDFETPASSENDALQKLKTHLMENTDALKEFTTDITFSAFIESLLR